MIGEMWLEVVPKTIASLGLTQKNDGGHGEVRGAASEWSLLSSRAEQRKGENDKKVTRSSKDEHEQYRARESRVQETNEVRAFSKSRRDARLGQVAANQSAPTCVTRW